MCVPVYGHAGLVGNLADNINALRYSNGVNAVPTAPQFVASAAPVASGKKYTMLLQGCIGTVADYVFVTQAFLVAWGAVDI